MEGESKNMEFDSTKLFSINPVFSESIFSILFSPTTPICFDPSGLLSEFIKRVFADNNYCYDLQDFHSPLEVNKSDNTKNLNDSQLSASQIETEVAPKEDIICLHDMNINIQDGFNSQYIKSLKSHWAPLMHKLGCFIITDLKDSKSQINKKVSIQDSGMSIFQTNIFVNNFRFNLGVEYEAKCTMIIVEPDCLKIIKESKDYNRQASVVSQVNYWISIKT